MNIKQAVLIAACACSVTPLALADASTPSRHRLMKECMRKQKDADSGKMRDDMRSFCEDWVKTQRDAAKNAPKEGR